MGSQSSWGTGEAPMEEKLLAGVLGGWVGGMFNYSYSACRTFLSFLFLCLCVCIFFCRFSLWAKTQTHASAYLQVKLRKIETHMDGGEGQPSLPWARKSFQGPAVGSGDALLLSVHFTDTLCLFSASGFTWNSDTTGNSSFHTNKCKDCALTPSLLPTENLAWYQSFRSSS